MNRLLFCLIFFFLLSLTASAQDDYFKVSMQYRCRPEVRNGYKTLATDSSKMAFFVGQRARLAFDYKKDNIISKISIQDSRTWGDEEMKKDIAGLQVNELWVELLLKKGFSLKLGRQELAYDDHRLLGNLDWANNTISHDALLVKYKSAKSDFQAHLGAAFNQSGEPLFGTDFTLNNYKYLALGWLKKDFSKIHSSLSFTAILNGVNSKNIGSTTPKASITAGPIFTYQANGFKALAGAYYQAGKTETNKDISAFMVNTYAELKKKKATIALGFDYLSGNSDKTDAQSSNNFSTLYATNHKFYGYMDYFLAIPTDTKQRGLVDGYARLGYDISKKVSSTLDFHQFMLANPNNLVAPKIGLNLGSEFDLIVDYKPSALVNLQMGYSMMFATTNMELTKGGSKGAYNGWFFAALKVSPTLFLHEFKD